MARQAAERRDVDLGETEMLVRAECGFHGELVFWAGIALSLFHVWANTLGTLDDLTLNALHWGGFGFLCALIMPMRAKGGRITGALDLVVASMVAGCAVYIVFASDLIYERGVRFVWTDWVVAITTVLLAIELARRTAGIVIPLLAVIGISYVTWLGPLVPGIFKFPGLTYETVLFRAVYEIVGMFGEIARISATFVFMFILFGAFLVRSGAGEFIIDLARAVAGRMIGGPGLVAVLGSALTGTVSGSAVANVVSTGVFTIPLMKKVGFPAKFAAGVEATASTGGQLMPPIMGAGAFVMANYTQLPYTTIAAVSLLPAVMYFASVAILVRIQAKKLDLRPLDEDSPSAMDVLKRGGPGFLFPLVLLMGMIMWGFTATYAAGFAILAVIAVSWIGPKPMGPREVLEALALGAKNMVSTSMLLITIGLVVMAVEISGVGNTMSIMITAWAGGNLIIAMALIAIVSLVLGMGLPVTASYIVLATLSAPALTQLINDARLVELITQGQLPQQAQAIFMLVAPDALAKLAAPMPEADAAALYALVPADFSRTLFEQALSPAILATTLLSAHMIIFWLSQDSNVTPPVCIAAFAAAAIAKTPPMATGLTAWRIAKGLYVVPILFAYTDYLSGDWAEAIRITVFGSFGLYALAAGYEGFAETRVPIWLRPIMFISGVALLWPMPVWMDLVALAVAIALQVLNWQLGRSTVAQVKR